MADKKTPKKPTAAKKTTAKKPKKAAASKPTGAAKSKRTAGAKKTASRAKPNSGKTNTRTNTSSQEQPRTATQAADAVFGRPVADLIWRLVAMVTFAIIANFGFIAYLVLASMQYVVVVITDKPNEELKGFMTRVASYLAEIFAYLRFDTDNMPFPFSEFPDA